MSAEFAKVLVPPPVAVPRGAVWASSLAARLAEALRRLTRPA